MVLKILGIILIIPFALYGLLWIFLWIVEKIIGGPLAPWKQ